jgi:hypothetical protein
MPYFRASNPVKVETIDTGEFSYYINKRVGDFVTRVPITKGTHLSVGLTRAWFHVPANYDLENVGVNSVTFTEDEAIITFHTQTTGNVGNIGLHFIISHVYI